MQSIPKMQEVGGVRGRYLPQAMLLPQEHAIALTIGRIIIWGTVNAIPQRTIEGLMAQISLTSANLGEKYHGAWFAPIYRAWQLSCVKGWPGLASMTLL